MGSSYAVTVVKEVILRLSLNVGHGKSVVTIVGHGKSVVTIICRMCRWTVNCVIQHNVVRPQLLVEAALHIQLGAKCSVKMKLCDQCTVVRPE